MFCASVMYQSDSEGFDFDYFRDHHVPMFAQALGTNCVRFEVHRGLDAPGAPPRPFVAAAYFWVASAEDFAGALSANAATVYSDIARFSQTEPTRGWAEVVA